MPSWCATPGPCRGCAPRSRQTPRGRACGCSGSPGPRQIRAAPVFQMQMGLATRFLGVIGVFHPMNNQGARATRSRAGRSRTIPSWPSARVVRTWSKSAHHPVPTAGRDVGVVAYLRPEVSFLSRLGDEHPVDDQVTAHGDVPDDQVMPVSKLADVEIHRVSAGSEFHAISVDSSRFPEPTRSGSGRNLPGRQSANCK